MGFLQSNLLALPHGMFDRHGGIGVPPYETCNISYGVGDDPENIIANRQLIKKSINIDFLVSTKQIHGNNIYICKDINDDTEVEGFDALITHQKNVGLLIQQADCQAILLHDPVNSVIAAIHCGWRGSVANIIKLTIVKMQDVFQTDPAQLFVVISPSLGPCCGEFINYASELPEQFYPFQEWPNHFNFWEISSLQLQETGVMPEHIDVTGICTCCNADYFSYRRSCKQGTPITGRNCSVISLPI